MASRSRRLSRSISAFPEIVLFGPFDSSETVRGFWGYSPADDEVFDLQVGLFASSRVLADEADFLTAASLLVTEDVGIQARGRIWYVPALFHPDGLAERWLGIRVDQAVGVSSVALVVELDRQRAPRVLADVVMAGIP